MGDRKAPTPLPPNSVKPPPPPAPPPKKQASNAADLTRAAQAAVHLCDSLLAHRLGATNTLIREVRDALIKGLGNG